MFILLLFEIFSLLLLLPRLPLHPFDLQLNLNFGFLLLLVLHNPLVQLCHRLLLFLLLSALSQFLQQLYRRFFYLLSFEFKTSVVLLLSVRLIDLLNKQVLLMKMERNRFIRELDHFVVERHLFFDIEVEMA